MQNSDPKSIFRNEILGLNPQVTELIPSGNNFVKLTVFILAFYFAISVLLSVVLCTALFNIFIGVLAGAIQIALIFLYMISIRRYTKEFFLNNSNRYWLCPVFCILGAILYAPAAILLLKWSLLDDIGLLSSHQLFELSKNGISLSNALIIFLSVILLLPCLLIEKGLKTYPIIIECNKRIITEKNKIEREYGNRK